VQGERATPLDIEEALYRVAQEALANVARHSSASQAQIELAWGSEQLRLTVQDDGAGFNTGAAEGRGLGLATMRERVEALGGVLTLSSSPGGTCVAACVPLSIAHSPESFEASAHE
jgi:signal transduction histidine kinase